MSRRRISKEADLLLLLHTHIHNEKRVRLWRLLLPKIDGKHLQSLLHQTTICFLLFRKEEQTFSPFYYVLVLLRRVVAAIHRLPRDFLLQSRRLEQHTYIYPGSFTPNPTVSPR